MAGKDGGASCRGQGGAPSLNTRWCAVNQALVVGPCIHITEVVSGVE